MTPFLLGLIGLFLAYPAPALLARSTWPYKAPRAAIFLWQSFALSAVLAVLGAGLSTALWLVTDSHLTTARVTAHFFVLALTAVVGARLAWSIYTVGSDTRRRRRRQRVLIDLLGEHDGAEPSLRILEEETPVAYCLPTFANSRVVVSRGALDSLDPEQLSAVLEHERAHVARRHDLVLEGFLVLHHAFPRLPGTDNALKQSQILVELLADDAARRVSGRLPLARALLALSDGPIPAGSLGAGAATAVRLDRLETDGGEHTGWASFALMLAAIVLVGPTSLLAVPWIIDAWRVLLSG